MNENEFGDLESGASDDDNSIISGIASFVDCLSEVIVH